MSTWSLAGAMTCKTFGVDTPQLNFNSGWLMSSSGPLGVVYIRMRGGDLVAGNASCITLF
jgi:hypothetical protein